MSFGIGRCIAEVQILKNSETGPVSWNFLNILIKLYITLLLTWARQSDCQMSFIISRGYAEVQIFKTSDPVSFWNILICICPNSEKSKTEKDITYLHM